MNRQQPSVPHVTFYTKAGCHLCDTARDRLDEIAEQQNYLLNEIDIRHDPALFEQYRYRIPVILIDETVAAEGRITYEDLVVAFQHHNDTLKA